MARWKYYSDGYSVLTLTIVNLETSLHLVSMFYAKIVTWIVELNACRDPVYSADFAGYKRFTQMQWLGHTETRRGLCFGSNTRSVSIE